MFYKQNKQVFEIIVRKDNTSIQNKSSDGVKGKSVQSGAMVNQSNIDEDSNVSAMFKSTKKVVATLGITSVVKQSAFTALNFYVSSFGTKNGDQSLQNQINRQVEVVSDTVNVLTSTISGGVTGAATAGVIGAVVGTLTGFASSMLSIGARQYERQRSYDTTMFKENNAIEYNRMRAGLNDTNGRSR